MEEKDREQNIRSNSRNMQNFTSLCVKTISMRKTNQIE